jgi:membrane protease YdiL (CAAX protease family)
VLAPVAEEIFFRGYIFRAMSARKGLARGLAYSSVLFGLVHLNMAAFLPLAVGAVVLALGFRRTGSLWTPIVAHALNNAFAFALLTFTAGG